MEIALWYVIGGFLLVLLALSSTVLARLPLSSAMLYLLIGVLASPLWLGLIWTDSDRNTVMLEHMTEAVVLVSLFTAGLKLSPRLNDRQWFLPIRLAFTSMVITVLLIAAAGVMLGMGLGTAIVLGAILAPTDPVLASAVQVKNHSDRDRLRFALTGEAGLNDGTAFPFLLLGLGLMGLHEIGDMGWRWVAVDLVWGTLGGLAVGGLLGGAIGWLVLYLRRELKEAVGLDEFLAVGLIALSYGAALYVQCSGFLAVFAAGIALRQLEQRETAASVARPGKDGVAVADDDEVAATSAVQDSAVDGAQADPRAGSARADALAVDARHAPAFMAHALLGFNEKLERIGEMAVVVTIGTLLWAVRWPYVHWWFVPLLLLVIRPVAVTVGLIGSTTDGNQRLMTSWFGVRGIGSLYYLMYAINHGVSPGLTDQLTALTLAVVVTSIVVHGVSVTPLMGLYERSRRKGGAAARRR